MIFYIERLFNRMPQIYNNLVYFILIIHALYNQYKFITTETRDGITFPECAP